MSFSAVNILDGNEIKGKLLNMHSASFTMPMARPLSITINGTGLSRSSTNLKKLYSQGSKEPRTFRPLPMHSWIKFHWNLRLQPNLLRRSKMLRNFMVKFLIFKIGVKRNFIINWTMISASSGNWLREIWTNQSYKKIMISIMLIENNFYHWKEAKIFFNIENYYNNSS